MPEQDIPLPLIEVRGGICTPDRRVTAKRRWFGWTWTLVDHYENTCVDCLPVNVRVFGWTYSLGSVKRAAYRALERVPPVRIYP